MTTDRAAVCRTADALRLLRCAMVAAAFVVGSVRALTAQFVAEDHQVVFHNEDPRRYVEGPGMVRMGTDHFVACISVVPRGPQRPDERVRDSCVFIRESRDGGRTWQPLSTLRYYSAVPFLHDGALYVFAMEPGLDRRNNDIVLLKSTDGGTSWSDPVQLFDGHFWNCQTAMVRAHGRLYWAVDDLSNGEDEPRSPRVIVADLAKDIMQRSAWRISNAAPDLPDLPMFSDPKFATRTGVKDLEPNVIEIGGRIHVLSTLKYRGQTTAGICVVFDVDDNGSELALRFARYNVMPGGQLKFGIVRDKESRLFWLVSNVVVDSQGLFDWWGTRDRQPHDAKGTGGNDRRIMMLSYSLDGFNWLPAGAIAQAPRLTQSFMYGAPVVDGRDLVVIARSSINGPNHHDADHATFHRVRNFRSLALDLVPEDKQSGKKRLPAK